MVISIEKAVPAIKVKVTGSIAHATEILLCLCQDIHKVSDIARQTGFSKSTVHRVLKLMEQSQMAVQDTINRRYYLGPLISQLASNAITTHKRLVTCADAEMKRLAYLSEETVVLDIMMGFKFASIYEIPSRHQFKVLQEIEKSTRLYARLYTGASVKALLAQLDDRRLQMLMSVINVTPSNGRPITDKNVLFSQIMDVRKLGYAISRSERIPDTICVSVPVFHYSVPVGLSVVGPEMRLQTRLREVVTELKASSLRVSKNICDVFGRCR